MITVTLPDGSQRQYEGHVSAVDVAKDISPSLAKVAIAACINNEVVDLSTVIDKDVQLRILTDKSPEALAIIRHSAAHLTAQAVQQCFPTAQVTIGPVIQDGFYYDFAFERPFTPEDLALIEDKMKTIVKNNLPITKRILSREDAIELFRSKGEYYKVEVIESIPTNEPLTLYRQGEFEDLCRGPHVASTGHLKAFKLTKVAGAYWRGDSNNVMLQRIYGTAWATKADLDAYLFRIEEAEKRDHRKLGKALGLFHFQDIAPGMVFWHADGWIIYQEMQRYIQQFLKQYDYQEIKTPQVVDKMLWEKSGHWENYRDNMFITETEKREFAIKPMSCPCHIQIFNQGIKSYRDLPIRYSEFGNCHRCEPSGSLHGLMRVRNMVQDDGHVFCTETQIEAEVAMFLTMVKAVYQTFGFTDIHYRLARRPEKRVGSDEVWDKAELALSNAMHSSGIEWEDAPGEGAFYGPKIECSLSDCLGRIWQCGTMQVDFLMPMRLDAMFIDADGQKKTPVMLHRAILGSFERFMGILIEHYAGKLPFWLAPKQVMVLTVSEKQHQYAKEVRHFLQSNEIRASIDLTNEKIGFKIREHTLKKIPYFVVIGDKEVDAKTVSIRSREGDDLGVKTWPELAIFFKAFLKH